MTNDPFLKGIEKDIKELLYEYIKVESYTFSPNERLVEPFLTDWFKGVPYFQEHPELCGLYEIQGDPFDRNVVFGMVKGRGSKAVVLIHHYDVVGIEDFKLLKDYAFKPDELGEKLMEVKDSLPVEAREDLMSGNWLFGRGGCDMKAGGSIQWTLLKRYSELDDFEGNVIVLAVPDEENMSAGMRAAVRLLAELKDKYDLNYRMMINSEPQQRKSADEGIFSEGTVGKIMPFIYVRGYLSHVGKVFEGFNPVNVMSEIVRRTELNMDFTDAVAGESSPPPTWLYLKDSKTVYDVSMPLSMAGCFSVLTLDQTPKSILDKVRNICAESFDLVLEDMHESYDRFCTVARPLVKELPWKTNVMSFMELYELASSAHGEDFRAAYDAELDALTAKISGGEINIIEANFELVEKVFEFVDDMSPRVIYGLIPPYYPNVSNYYFEGLDDRKDISGTLNDFTTSEFGERYTNEYFYTGICDLSFSGIKKGSDTTPLDEYMPLSKCYDIPFDALEKISMPCINIGPWGKDFHKLTERVSKTDLYERTPRILDYAIRLLLK
ncbi:MAG: M20/M25/M40 family metallo-hydrolase [Firmicutes bacterium]|nr:M20/M25/M40 family metallo-hydrolase [Bacillota bacterium]